MLQSISNFGRLILKVLTLGKFNLPRTDDQAVEEGLKGEGFMFGLGFMAKNMAIDCIYFFTGLAALVAIIWAGALIFVAIAGPITPVHQWGGS